MPLLQSNMDYLLDEDARFYLCYYIQSGEEFDVSKMTKGIAALIVYNLKHLNSDVRIPDSIVKAALCEKPKLGDPFYEVTWRVQSILSQYINISYLTTELRNQLKAKIGYKAISDAKFKADYLLKFTLKEQNEENSTLDLIEKQTDENSKAALTSNISLSNISSNGNSSARTDCPPPSTPVSKEDFDGTKCKFTFDFINSNCIIQDNGLVLPKPNPTSQFKDCLTFYLQKGYSLPFKLPQEFFNFITTGKGFAEYSNGKSDWSKLSNISRIMSRMSIWKPKVRPMSVQFENRSPSVSVELKDLLLSLVSLDLARLQSLIFFSTGTGKTGKKGQIMFTIVLDSNRNNCAISLGFLVIPQFKDKELLKKQINELLENDYSFEKKKVRYNDSRKDKNENSTKPKELNGNESKKPKRTNAIDRKPLTQKRIKLDVASSSNQSSSAQTTTTTTTTTTNTTTTLTTLAQTTPTDFQFTKNSKSAKDTEFTVPPQCSVEKDDNMQPQKEVKLDLAPSSNQSPSAHTTTTTTSTTALSAFTHLTTETASQFIKNPLIYHETVKLEFLYTKFEIIVNKIYPHNFESCFDRLEYLLKNDLVEYIALDCEMTGLYTLEDDERHSRDYNTLFINNTKQITDGAKTNSIFQFGLVIKARQGGWSIWSFNTAPHLFKESFIPSTFKFLFETPLSEKYPQASSEAKASMISTKLETISSASISHKQFSSLANLLITSSSPLIVFSGYADLLYLFKAVGRNVDELDHDAVQAQLPNRIYDLKSVCIWAAIRVVGKPSLFTYFRNYYSHLKENKYSLHDATFDAVLTAMLYEALKTKNPGELQTKNGLFNYEKNN